MDTKTERMMEVWLRDHTPPTSEDIGKIATALALLGHMLRNGGRWDAACEQYSKDAHDALTKIGAFYGMTNAAPQMYDALLNVRSIIAEAAMTGFNYKDGDWPDRLFHSQQKTSAVTEGGLSKALKFLKDRRIKARPDPAPKTTGATVTTLTPDERQRMNAATVLRRRGMLR